MKLPLYIEAAVSCDLPDQGLRRGDVVKLVDEHSLVDGSAGYSVEVLNALGDTLKVTALPVWALEPLRMDEVLCVRPA
ncbi:MAG: hypothetical protein RLZZ350_1430 [Verrucomicrobiota bacterium]|jgi:hypothetical protein